MPRRGTTELVSTVVMPPVASLSTVSARTPRLKERWSPSVQVSLTKYDVVLMSIFAPRTGSQFNISEKGPWPAGMNTGDSCWSASSRGEPSASTA